MREDRVSTNPQYLEQCITKGLMEVKEFVVLISGAFEADYFDHPAVQEIFTYTKAHFTEYKEIPDPAIMLNNIPADRRESVQDYIQEIAAVDIDIVRHYSWLKTESNAYLKDKAIKEAVRSSIDVINSGEDAYEIRTLVETALCRTLDNSIGLDYFGDIGPRLARMFTDTTHRIPTYFPIFDEFINGGFPPKTLSVFVAKIHGFKSNVMANMIARQVQKGHNIALASLEMSEDMFAQRFDGIYSLMDINRFYFNQQMQRQLMEKMREIKNTPGRGNLFIKSFPTGKGSVNDFRSWLRELSMRGIDVDAFYFDYLNLMSSTEVKKGEGSYSEVKSIAEETRSLGFEFNIPMISVSQLNRAGTFMSFEDVDFNSIAESMGVPATADFMMIMGSNDDHMVYKNEVHYKIVKNRLGGRVGEMDKFFYDAHSMKMYCSSEMNVWMNDITVSGDTRENATVIDRPLNDYDNPTGSRRRRDG